MEYRRVGNSGLRVSEISLGAWLTFGASVNEDVTRDCVKAALESGINFLDLADIYALGEAERTVGRVIRDLGVRRQDLVLSSKVYWPMSEGINDRGLSRKHIMESIEASLRRLGTDYLDLYFCHRYDPDTPVEEVVRAMDDLVHQGKVLYWGTSVWSAAQIESAVGAAEAVHAYRPQVEQPRYNMLDRHIEPEIVPVCDRHGIGLTVFSPLAQGLLTGKYNEGVPPESRGATSHWLDRELTLENLMRVRALSRLALDWGLTPSQLALAWILRLPQVCAVITGASNARHVLDNVRAAEVHLDKEMLEHVEYVLSGEKTASEGPKG